VQVSELRKHGHTPTLSPAYDFVATLPYITNDKLALNFGGSHGFEGIIFNQVRCFTDTAGLPMTLRRFGGRLTTKIGGATARNLRELSQGRQVP
jgi:serine/threonine-protein kinase HipA